MPIREKGYYNWEGELTPHPIKWLPIFFTGIKKVYKKRFSKMMFLPAVLFFLVTLAGIFIYSRPELNMATKLAELIGSDANLFRYYYANWGSLFMMLILAIFSGADLIAGDIKFKSFTLYLARPISRFDYIVGKSSIILFYLLLFSLAPGLLLLFFKILFTGSISITPQLFLAALLYPIIIALFMTSMTIMFSTLSSNTKLVQIMVFMFYFMTDLAAVIFKNIFRHSLFGSDNPINLISIRSNGMHFGAFLFGTEGGFYTHGLLAGCVLLTLTVIFFVIALARIKRVEV
ncbi:MAG: hypothetical protein GY757_45540 [bacterium]|nr:hypothetical protein [bacterium]